MAVRRLVERGLGEEQAWARIRAQIPIDQKRRLADHVIDNSDGLDTTRRQVEELWAQVSSGQVGLGK